MRFTSRWWSHRWASCNRIESLLSSTTTMRLLRPLAILSLLHSPIVAAGSDASLTGTAPALAAIGLFLLAYALVIAEEFISLRKSKSVVVAAGLIWVLVALAHAHANLPGAADLLRHNLLEYAELLLFLLAAMTYVNTLEERGIFRALRDWLIARGFTLRVVFWVTGLFAFFLSPFLDNLTTALVMGSVVLSVGAGHPRFISLP